MDEIALVQFADSLDHLCGQCTPGRNAEETQLTPLLFQGDAGIFTHDVIQVPALRQGM